MDNDYLCDHALKLFAETGACSEMFFVVGQSSSGLCFQRVQLTRRLLNAIMWCVIKAKNEDVKALRMIFENMPSLVKSLNEITTDAELQIMNDQYFEEVLDFYQILAQEGKESFVIKDLLENLIDKTRLIIKKYRDKLKTPLLLDIYEDHQRRLKEKLESGPDTPDDEYQDPAHAQHPVSNLDSSSCGEEEEKSENEDIEPVSDLEIDNISQPENVEDNLSSSNIFQDILSSSHFIDDSSSSEADIATTETQTSTPNDKKKSPAVQGVAINTASSVESLSSDEVNANVVDAVESAISQADDGEKKQETTSNKTENSADVSKSSFSGVDVGISKQKHRKKRTFSLESDAMLVHGVQAYGVGSWKEILNNYSFPPYRNSVHLKDRWRTLLHTDVVSYVNGRIKILRQQQADVFQKLSDQIKAQKEASIPVIKLTPLSKQKTSPKPSTPQSIKQPSPISKPTESLSNEENQDEEPADERKRKSNFSTPQSLKKTKQFQGKHKRRRRLWDVEGESLEWDDDAILKPNNFSHKSLLLPSSSSKSSTRKHKRKPWSQSEISNLVSGLRRYGIGQWAMILDQFEFSNRNAVMLKDKYRNMRKNDQLPDDLKPSSNT